MKYELLTRTRLPGRAEGLYRSCPEPNASTMLLAVAVAALTGAAAPPGWTAVWSVWSGCDCSGDASSEPLEREVTEGAPSRPPRSSANAEPPCRSERPPDEGPSCDRAEPRSDRGESCDCVEATDMVEGESRPSRGVIGGVGHVRGDAFGHERGDGGLVGGHLSPEGEGCPGGA